MNNAEFKAAIERNADTIVITIFVFLDVAVSLLILDYAASKQAPLSNSLTPLQIHIDTHIFRAGILFKSLISYMAAFATARRLP